MSLQLREMHAAQEDRLSKMARQMTRWVDQVLGPTYHRYCPDEVWTPAINLYESNDNYCIVVELAGMDAQTIDLQVEKGSLVLSGDRPSPPTLECPRPTRVHLMEIDHGRFTRSIELPNDVDAEDITASYRGGYLFVRLPKKPY